MTKNTHQNEENEVKCPVEGCNHEGLSRGIHLHVRQSSGGGHGPNGEVPEHLDLNDLEVVGTKSVKMDYPDKREDDETVRLCPYCGRAYQGFRGVKIHVGQKVGQGVHPDDATNIEIEDCPIAHVDEDMNVIEVVDAGSMMPSTKARIMDDVESVEKDKVLKFIEEMEAAGNSEAADRAEELLL